MATEKDTFCQNYCANDPNFAIICSFFDRFANICGITYPTFLELQEMLENPQDVPPELIDLHVKLLRKIRRSVATEKWERALIKFCHSYYCNEDGWELERCGYKKCKVSVKLRILKTLLDAQFDLNSKFKTDINKLTAEELRIEPLGRDNVGQSYWCQFDSAANVRVYKEDHDEETWKLVAKDRGGLVDLITQLSSGEELLGLELINEEDSNSQEVEKPIIDTGQVEVSTSEDNTADNISSIDVKIENNVKAEENSNSIGSLNNASSPAENIEFSMSKLEECALIEKEQEIKESVALFKESTKSPVDNHTNQIKSSNKITQEEDNLKNMVKRRSSQKEVVDNGADITNSETTEKSEPTASDLSLKSNTVKEVEEKPQIKLVNEDTSRNPLFIQPPENSSINVAEEIKQRSLSKSNNLNLFKGKNCKSSSGSKLDQIFSRKLEQSTVGTLLDTDNKSAPNLFPIINVDKLEDDSKHVAFNDNKTCDKIMERTEESDSYYNEVNCKRKCDNVDEQPTKKTCLEVDNDEVGEEIEEPVMIIQGEGLGKECDTGNPGRDNDDGVKTENISTGPSSNSNANVSKKTNQTTSDYKVPNFENSNKNSEIEPKNSNLNNGVIDNNDKISETCFDNDCNKTEHLVEKNITQPSLDYDKTCNKMTVTCNSVDNVSKEDPAIDEKSDSSTHVKPKDDSLNISNAHEKSIEEQLSDITGECFSPKQPEEPLQELDNVEKQDCIISEKHNAQRIRRQSLECSEKDDYDTVSPEAKKTKIVEDALDIFGDSIDESPTYSSEKGKPYKIEKDSEELNILKKKQVLDNCLTLPDTINKGNQIENIPKTVNTSIIKNTNIDEHEVSLNGKEETNANKQELCKKNIKEENSSVTIPKSTKGNNENKSKNYSKNSLKNGSDHIKCNTIEEDNETSLNNNPEDDHNNLLGNKPDVLEEKEVNNAVSETEEPEKEFNLKNSKEGEIICEKKLDFLDEANSEQSVTKGQLGSTTDTVKTNQKSDNEENESCKENESCVGLSVENSGNGMENKKLHDTPSKESGKSSNTSVAKDDESADPNKKKSATRKPPKARRKIFTSRSKRKKNKTQNKNCENKEPNDCPMEEKENVKTTNLNSEEKLERNSNKEQCDEKDEEIETQTNKKMKDTTKAETKPAPIASRKRRSSRRNTGTERDSEEDIILSDRKEIHEPVPEDEEIGGKRRKLKGKRSPNKTLRKSIEEKRNSKSSSEEEPQHDTSEEKDSKKSVVQTKQKPRARNLQNNVKKGSSKTKNNSTSPPKIKKKEPETTDIAEEPLINLSVDKKKKSSKSQGRNSRAYLGIDLNIDLSDTSRSVRQSSRLAQIKIKEQADPKMGEDNQVNTEKQIKKFKKKKEENEEKQKGTPRKKNRAKKIVEDDIPEEELSEKKKGRRKKKKNPVKAFNERDPWKSSSGSSSEAEEDEADHFDEFVEEEEEELPTLKSDHEFSPESDLEGDGEIKPIRHARTAQKVSVPSPEAGDESKDIDDFACEKCGKKDHPEWILLCDTCDHGWHASCLRPSLMLVPEGDWHCPPCQHIVLVKRLQETLKIFDRDSKRRENEELRKKRLAYVGISLDNVLPSNMHHPRDKRDHSGSDSESSESSASESESSSELSDEPVYQLRQRRQGTTSYRFNEYDDLINSAIQEEVAGKHGIGLLETVPQNTAPVIIKQEETKIEGELSKEKEKVQIQEEKVVSNISGENEEEKLSKPKKKDKHESGEETSEEDDDNEDDEDEVEEEEFPRVVPKRNNVLPRPGKKKHRRLNCLDDPSDDDDGSDEDFKGSSSAEEEDDEEDDYSDESGTGRRGRSKRGHLGPVRRSSRTRRSRFDKEFINDNSDESDAPRRKKTKKLWSDSDSESEDSTWGRRKKKKSYSSSGRRRVKKNRKFTIEDELSDLEAPQKVEKKKRQRKVKYGGLDELAVDDLPTRRTRGKKINYQEVLGSDSDEEIQKPKNLRRAIIDDEDDFVVEKEEKEESRTSSGGEGAQVDDEKSSDEEEEVCEIKEIVKEDTKEAQKTPEPPPINTSPPKLVPPKMLNIDKSVSVRRGRPPKAMIAPPPERLISEDEQYKAIVSKVATLGHSDKNTNDNIESNIVKSVNIHELSNCSSEVKEFGEPIHHLTPIKVQNSSFDPKFVKRNPPIKIRSGVPVNAAGRKSPVLSSPTNETSFFPVNSPNSGIIHSPPEKLQFPLQMQRTLVPIQTNPQQFVSPRKINNPPVTNIKSEVVNNEEDLDDLDEEDLMEDIEEEEEDEDDSEDDILEEGEIPKKVARRMARIEERMQRLEEKRIARQMKDLKSVQSGAVTIQPISSPGSAHPPANTPSSQSEQKSTPTTQPTQPLLRVVSPLKLMANPPGPLQSTFMHSGINPRMPMSSPPSARMPMSMRPPQPTNMMPVMGMDDGSAKRRGRGRGKKQLAQEKPEQEMMGGGSVIRGMLQTQSYPPTHYPQQYPPHPRIPYNPQRMPRPPFHPGHHPLDPSPSGGGTINVKQEPGVHPPTNPVHIPNKPTPSSAPSYHPPPQHRFEGIPRQPNYSPQGNSPQKPPYGNYHPPPAPSANYHYGSYPPPINPREEPQAYPVQQQQQPPQQYNEQFADQTAAPVASPNSKGFAEEDSGEFGGLVSYFSSQREDDIDT